MAESTAVLKTFEAVSTAASGPVKNCGLVETNVWLQGPNETAGIAFGKPPYSLRTARTRHWTVLVKAGSSWRV